MQVIGVRKGLSRGGRPLIIDRLDVNRLAIRLHVAASALSGGVLLEMQVQGRGCIHITMALHTARRIFALLGCNVAVVRIRPTTGQRHRSICIQPLEEALAHAALVDAAAGKRVIGALGSAIGMAGHASRHSGGTAEALWIVLRLHMAFTAGHVVVVEVLESTCGAAAGAQTGFKAGLNLHRQHITVVTVLADAHG